MLVDGDGHLLAKTQKPSNDLPLVACPTVALTAGRARKCGFNRKSKNPQSIVRTERRARSREARKGNKIVGGARDDQDERKNPPPVSQLPGRRKKVVSEEEKNEYLRRIGNNMIEYVSEVMEDTKGGQCQLLAPLIRKMAVGKDSESSIPAIGMAHLLEIERIRAKELILRGKEEKLEILTAQTREKKPRGTYVSIPESKCTRKFVASCGELFSSSSNKYKITISEQEVLSIYIEDGVKTILLTMLTQFPGIYRPMVERYCKLSEADKEKVPEKGFLKALYCIHLWEQKKFEGECPPFKWKRSKEKFWEIVNMKKENSRKKIMKTFFGIKLHPCKYCNDFEEEIEIYEELAKSVAEEKDPVLLTEKKKRLGQWSSKIEALRRHKDKHEQQRKAVQKFKDECKYHPGMCLVYEDFCNLYEANNAKMLNLVMVLIYWDGKEVQEDYDTFLSWFSNSG